MPVSLAGNLSVMPVSYFWMRSLPTLTQIPKPVVYMPWRHLTKAVRSSPSPIVWASPWIRPVSLKSNSFFLISALLLIYIYILYIIMEERHLYEYGKVQKRRFIRLICFFHLIFEEVLIIHLKERYEKQYESTDCLHHHRHHHSPRNCHFLYDIYFQLLHVEYNISWADFQCCRSLYNHVHSDMRLCGHHPAAAADPQENTINKTLK